MGFIPFDSDHHEENISSVCVEMLQEKINSGREIQLSSIAT